MIKKSKNEINNLKRKFSNGQTVDLPKRRGRPPKPKDAPQTNSSKKRGRPRKIPLSSTNLNSKSSDKHDLKDALNDFDKLINETELKKNSKLNIEEERIRKDIENEYNRPVSEDEITRRFGTSRVLRKSKEILIRNTRSSRKADESRPELFK